MPGMVGWLTLEERLYELLERFNEVIRDIHLVILCGRVFLNDGEDPVELRDIIKRHLEEIDKILEEIISWIPQYGLPAIQVLAWIGINISDVLGRHWSSIIVNGLSDEDKLRLKSAIYEKLRQITPPH